MIKKIFWGMAGVSLMLIVNFFTPSASWADDAMEDLETVYQDTSAFDGGPGSTINTSPAAYDEY
jgi:hypothetical protein